MAPSRDPRAVAGARGGRTRPPALRGSPHGRRRRRRGRRQRTPGGGFPGRSVVRPDGLRRRSARPVHGGVSRRGERLSVHAHAAHGHRHRHHSRGRRHEHAPAHDRHERSGTRRARLGPRGPSGRSHGVPRCRRFRAVQSHRSLRRCGLRAGGGLPDHAVAGRQCLGPLWQRAPGGARTRPRHGSCPLGAAGRELRRLALVAGALRHPTRADAALGNDHDLRPRSSWWGVLRSRRRLRQWSLRRAGPRTRWRQRGCHARQAALSDRGASRAGKGLGWRRHRGCLRRGAERSRGLVRHRRGRDRGQRRSRRRQRRHAGRRRRLPPRSARVGGRGPRRHRRQRRRPSGRPESLPGSGLAHRRGRGARESARCAHHPRGAGCADRVDGTLRRDHGPGRPRVGHGSREALAAGQRDSRSVASLGPDRPGAPRPGREFGGRSLSAVGSDGIGVVGLVPQSGQRHLPLVRIGGALGSSAQPHPHDLPGRAWTALLRRTLVAGALRTWHHRRRPRGNRGVSAGLSVSRGQRAVRPASARLVDDVADPGLVEQQRDGTSRRCPICEI